METEKRKLFLVMNKKSVYRNKKIHFAKFSGISPTEKMALQNFPTFFQLKKWFCKIFQRFSN